MGRRAKPSGRAGSLIAPERGLELRGRLAAQWREFEACLFGDEPADPDLYPPNVRSTQYRQLERGEAVTVQGWALPAWVPRLRMYGRYRLDPDGALLEVGDDTPGATDGT